MNRCILIIRLRRALAETEHWPERDPDRMAVRTFALQAGILTLTLV